MQTGATVRLSAVAVAIWGLGVCVRVSSCNECLGPALVGGEGRGLDFDLDSEYCLD